MKKNIFFSSIIAVIGIMTATPAFAAITYSRSPSGSNPTSPVTISFSTNDPSGDLGLTPNYWCLTIDRSPFPPQSSADMFLSPLYTSSSFTESYAYTLPDNDYGAVNIWYETDGYVPSSCADLIDNGTAANNLGLEGSNSDPEPVTFTIGAIPLDCNSGGAMGTTTLGTKIDCVNSTSTGYFGVLISKYWPFAVGFLILLGVWYYGKKILSNFR